MTDSDYIVITERAGLQGRMLLTVSIEVPVSDEALRALPRTLTGQQARERFRRLCEAYLAVVSTAEDLADV